MVKEMAHGDTERRVEVGIGEASGTEGGGAERSHSAMEDGCSVSSMTSTSLCWSVASSTSLCTVAANSASACSALYLLR